MEINADQSLGFLVSDIARMLREQFNWAAQKLGLTLAQTRALAHLARHEGISQTALAGLLEIQPITLLRQIDRLQDMGLVERRPNPSDRRAQQLFLTPAAEPLLAILRDLGGELTDRAFGDADDATRQTLMKGLLQIKTNLSEASGKLAPAALRQRL